MQLIILSPLTKKTFTVDWIEVNTPTGNFVIQPEHAPTILTLSRNNEIIFQVTDGGQEKILVPAGIAHVTRNSLTLMLSS